MATQTIVLIDDDHKVLEVVASMLESPEYEILKYTDAKEALNVVRQQDVDLVITDLRMSPLNGMEVLRAIKAEKPQVEVLISTAHGTVETAIQAMKEGAIDYLVKPIKMEELRISVARIFQHEQLCKENLYLRGQLEERFGLGNMVGKSPVMQKIFYLIQKVCATDLTVLICGESGTGKELVARAIHQGSVRKNHPFVALNCGSIPEPLLESELFGHVKGAFTGAIANKKGLFEEADKGTILLDEISATSHAVQVSLLRVLQEMELRKVGDTKSCKIDVRVLAATNLDLEEEVKKQKFREDLYYRLSVVHILLPPLRERKEDIPILVEHFLKKYAKHGREVCLQEGVLQALMAHDWPGNVRELENLLEGASSLSENGRISMADLPERILDGYRGSQNFGANLNGNLKDYLRGQEKIQIEKVLVQTKQDRKRAAEKLGISLPSLYRKAEYLGVALPKPQKFPCAAD